MSTLTCAQVFPTPDETFTCYQICEILRSVLEQRIPLHPEPLHINPTKRGWSVLLFTIDGDPAAAGTIDMALCGITKLHNWPERWTVRRVSGPDNSPGCWPVNLPEPRSWTIIIRR